MSIEGGITFFLAIFIFGITPGPGVFAILARAMVFGAPSCTALAFGMTISDALYLILASLGLAAVAHGGWRTVVRPMLYDRGRLAASARRGDCR